MTQHSNRARGSKINPSDAIAQSVEGPLSYEPQRLPYDTPQQQAFAEPETYIVQNIFPGPQFISDIRLSFKPFEVIDLTWEDPRYVKRSTDLARALRAGFLRKLSKEEWQIHLDNEALAQRQATQNAMNNQSLQQQRQFNVDGKMINADIIDMDGNVKGHTGEDVSTAGNWNDPSTYAIEENRARAAAIARGQRFDAAEYGKWVQREVEAGRRGPVESGRARNSDMGGPALPGSNIQFGPQANMFPNGATSGHTERGTYTVIDGDNRIQQGNLTNLNRDGVLAGTSASGIGVIPHDVESPALAEHIDLNSDEAYGYDGEDSGGIKRMF